MTTINVTQKHIDEGCRVQASNCPVAKALNDIIVRPLHACVSQTRIGLGVEGEKEFRFVANAPDDAQLFISDFDFGSYVKPFSFDLDIPAEFLK